MFNITKKCLLAEKNDEEAWLWHRRICRQSAHTLQDMIRGNHVDGFLDYLKYDHTKSFCVLGKLARPPFSSSTEFRASKTLQLVYAKLRGPIIPSLLGRGRYL